MRKNKDTSLGNILRIALPIGVQQLLISCMHIVDAAFVVRLGNAAVTGVGAAGRIMFMYNVIVFGLGSAMMVVVSQFWGINDKKTIHNAFGLGLVNVMIIASVSTALCLIFPRQIIMIFTNDANTIAEGAKYLQIVAFSLIPLTINMIYTYLLRATENVILPVIISIAGVLLNTFLNYILIFGHFGFPAMGIEGAAIATVISAIIQFVLLISICIITKNIAYAKLSDMIPRSSEIVKKFYSIAKPVIIHEVIWAVGVNVYIMVLARQGIENYAAYTIFTTIEQLAFTFFIGLCSACAVLVGKMIGRGENEQAILFSKKFIFATVGISAVLGSVVYFSAPTLINFFNIESITTKLMTIKLLRIYSIGYVFHTLTFILICGIFRAAGNANIGLILDIICVWILTIPVLYVAGFVLKVSFEVLYVLTFIEQVVKTIICFIIFFRKKWIRQLTDTNKDNETEFEANNEVVLLDAD